MSYLLQQKPVAFVKANVVDYHREDDEGQFIFNGITTETTTADNVVAQLNKILILGGKKIVDIGGVTRHFTEEAVQQ